MTRSVRLALLDLNFDKSIIDLAFLLFSARHFVPPFMVSLLGISLECLSRRSFEFLSITPSGKGFKSA